MPSQDTQTECRETDYKKEIRRNLLKIYQIEEQKRGNGRRDLLFRREKRRT